MASLKASVWVGILSFLAVVYASSAATEADAEGKSLSGADPRFAKKTALATPYHGGGVYGGVHPGLGFNGGIYPSGVGSYPGYGYSNGYAPYPSYGTAYGNGYGSGYGNVYGNGYGYSGYGGYGNYGGYGGYAPGYNNYGYGLVGSGTYGIGYGYNGVSVVG